VSEAPAAVHGLTARLSELAADLRARGVRLGVGELLGAHRALAAVDASDRAACRLALRAVLCSRREDLEAFDEAFVAVFGAAGQPLPDQPDVLDDVAKLVLPRVAVPPERGRARPQPQEETELVPAAWSDEELLRDKDFAAYTAAERAAARRVLARLAARGPIRPSRRLRAAHRIGAPPRSGRPDLQRTLRASMRHGGEPLRRHWREPGNRPRPLVLVCDVSGSMEPYARVLLSYMQACVAARRRVEAFAFGTRLTRVTRELRARDPDQALASATQAIADRSGGTRIGDSLAALNREHGGRVGRGALVVLLSDGWDRGEPDVLAAEMRRLRRCAHRVVWLNPLKAGPDYEPLTRGMVAALPHVDRFLAGNSLRSLEELAGLMEGGIDWTR
jgi:uncharacterized protein with von Willebrand factor type A (vWA) domain